MKNGNNRNRGGNKGKKVEIGASFRNRNTRRCQGTNRTGERKNPRQDGTVRV